MAIAINIYYTGQGDDAMRFASEMMSSGIVKAIREEKGNLKYEYFAPLNMPNTILLIDMWESQEALDIHHSLPLMSDIMRLREKYNLKMRVERFVSDNESVTENDKKFIKTE